MKNKPKTGDARAYLKHKEEKKLTSIRISESVIEKVEAIAEFEDIPICEVWEAAALMFFDSYIDRKKP